MTIVAQRKPFLFPALWISCTVAFAQSGQTAEDVAFGELMTHYFQQDDPQFVPRMIAYLNLEETWSPKWTQQLVGFFGSLGSHDPSTKRELLSRQDEVKTDLGKRFVSSALNTAVDAYYWKNPPTPGMNDMVWSSYFASGDTRYLELLLGWAKRFAHDRTNQTRYLAGASALWSLAINGCQLPEVKTFLTEQLLFEDSPVTYEGLEKDPAQLTLETIDVIRKQREQGLLP